MRQILFMGPKILLLLSLGLMIVVPIYLWARSSLMPLLVNHEDQTWQTHLSEQGYQAKVLKMDPQGRIWFGGIGYGSNHTGKLAYFNGQEWKDFSEEEVGVLPNITDIDFDSHGMVWASVGWRNVVRETVVVFDGISWKENNPGFNGTECSIETLAVTKDDRVWVGSQDCGIAVFDGSSWSHLDDEPALHGIQVFSIEVDDRNQVWVGTKDQGLFVLKNGKWMSYSLKDFPELWDFDQLIIWQIAFDQDNHVWLGLGNSGFVRFNMLSDESDKLSGLVEYDDIYYVNSMAVGQDGKIYAGCCVKGFIAWENGKWSSIDSFTGSFGSSKHLKNVEALTIDQNGRLWFTMEEGIGENNVTVMSVNYDKLKATPSSATIFTPFQGVILLVIWIILLFSRNDGLPLTILKEKYPLEYEQTWRAFPKRWTLSNGIALLAVTGLVILTWMQVEGGNLIFLNKWGTLTIQLVALCLESAIVIAAMQWIGLGPHCGFRGSWAGFSAVGFGVFPPLSFSLLAILVSLLAILVRNFRISSGNAFIISIVFFPVILPITVMLALALTGFFCGILQAYSLKVDRVTARKWWKESATSLAISVLLLPVWGFIFGMLSNKTLRGLIFPGEPIPSPQAAIEPVDRG